MNFILRWRWWTIIITIFVADFSYITISSFVLCSLSSSSSSSCFFLPYPLPYSPLNILVNIQFSSLPTFPILLFFLLLLLFYCSWLVSISLSLFNSTPTFLVHFGLPVVSIFLSFSFFSFQHCSFIIIFFVITTIVVIANK